MLGLREEVGRAEFGVGLSSATISTSLGPAGRSMPTRPETSSFAAVTQRLPGPTILSTAVSLGAVGERRDRLRAADRVDLVDPELSRGRQQHRGRPRRDTAIRDSRELRGHDGHHQRGRDTPRDRPGRRRRPLRSAETGASSRLPGRSTRSCRRTLRLVEGTYGDREPAEAARKAGSASAPAMASAGTRMTGGRSPSRRSVQSRTASSPRSRTSATISAAAAGHRRLDSTRVTERASRPA